MQRSSHNPKVELDWCLYDNESSTTSIVMNQSNRNTAAFPYMFSKTPQQQSLLVERRESPRTNEMRLTRHHYEVSLTSRKRCGRIHTTFLRRRVVPNGYRVVQDTIHVRVGYCCSRAAGQVGIADTSNVTDDCCRMAIERLVDTRVSEVLRTGTYSYRIFYIH